MEDDFAQRQPDDGFDDGLFWSNGNAGKINGNQFIGSTIVSTPMMLQLADAYGVECKVG
jgi:hypothetical protein